MENSLVELLNTMDKEFHPFKIKHRYGKYEIVAVEYVSHLKKQPLYDGYIYFKNPENKNLTTFVRSFTPRENTDTLRKFLKEIKNSNEFITIDRKVKYGVSEILLNKEISKKLTFNIEPEPVKKYWTVSAYPLYMKIPDEEFKNLMGDAIINVNLSKNMLLTRNTNIENRKKSIQSTIKSLEASLKEQREELKKISEYERDFENMNHFIEQYLGEDEYASQLLLYQFTKGNFKNI